MLAILHDGELVRGKVRDKPLRAGGALLIEIRREHLRHLRENPAFLVVSSRPRVPATRRKRMPVAIAVMVAVVLAAATGLVPIAVSAVAGALAMVLTGCLKPSEVYRAVEWKVIFLLAGMLALGTALEKTGAAALLAGEIVRSAGWLGPVALLSALYVLTSLLTEAISNNAAVVLLAPIAMAAAESLGLNVRPFLVAVMFAASSSFMTPVGYQTNTMIYGPGRYLFSDFFRVGAPLNLLFWGVATLLIPLFWPLR